jgi:hypothetical protein
MRYFDKQGNEILAGMVLRPLDGETEMLYKVTRCGDDDLGFEVMNECYSLSELDLNKFEISHLAH